MKKGEELSFELIDEIEDKSLSFFDDLQILIRAMDNWDNTVVTIGSYLNNIELFIGRDLKVSIRDINEILEDSNNQMSLWKHESFFELSKLIKTENEILEDKLDELISSVQAYLNRER